MELPINTTTNNNTRIFKNWHRKTHFVKNNRITFLLLCIVIFINYNIILYDLTNRNFMRKLILLQNVCKEIKKYHLPNYKEVNFIKIAYINIFIVNIILKDALTSLSE